MGILLQGHEQSAAQAAQAVQSEEPRARATVLLAEDDRALRLANRGFMNAISSDPGLKEGVNTYAGKLTYKAVADDQGLEYSALDELLGLAPQSSSKAGGA